MVSLMQPLRTANAADFLTGEVFVMDDGGESDLDCGNYERARVPPGSYGRIRRADMLFSTWMLLWVEITTLLLAKCTSRSSSER